jgi:hypothetical protein
MTPDRIDLRDSAAISIGHRVIRASARHRTSDVLGTVLERSDRLLRIGFEDGRAAWVHRSLLKRLGDSCCPDALAEWEAKHA